MNRIPLTGRAAIGLDLGGTKCLGALVSDSGEVLSAQTVPSPGRSGPEAVLRTLESVARHLIAEAEVPVAAVGVGVPGLITRQGELRFAGHLGGRLELPLGTLMPQRLGIPVVVDNDNTCAAYAEWVVGAGHGFDDLLFVGLGTGIGGGIVAGGELQRGANGFAGEIGHLGVDSDGPPCSCGRRGCWELMASGSALGRQGEEAVESGAWNLPVGVDRPVRGLDVMVAAAHGDRGAHSVVERYAGYLAAGLVNLTMVLDPACIVLGGGAMTRSDVLLPLVHERFDHLLGGSAGLRPVPVLRAARFGPHAGAVGAALLALHAVPARPTPVGP